MRGRGAPIPRHYPEWCSWAGCECTHPCPPHLRPLRLDAGLIDSPRVAGEESLQGRGAQGGAWAWGAREGSTAYRLRPSRPTPRRAPWPRISPSVVQPTRRCGRAGRGAPFWGAGPPGEGPPRGEEASHAQHAPLKGGWPPLSKSLAQGPNRTQIDPCKNHETPKSVHKTCGWSVATGTGCTGADWLQQPLLVAGQGTSGTATPWVLQQQPGHCSHSVRLLMGELLSQS